ncbi:MAG: hypothetical protein NTW21_12900 [Verrucomicrobia bacterium]|nr:hypothetical protein [Verrucomicrobiota bacterium]
MKTRKFIFTHAVVFAAGAVLASMAYRPAAKQREEEAAAAGRHSLNGAGEMTGADDRATARDRRASQNPKSRTNGAPAQRMADIVRLGDPLERQSALMDLLGRLGPGEFAAVADQYRSMDHFGGSQGEYDLILRSWAKADPLGALAYAGQQPDNWRDTSLILASWAGNDTAAAERWALDHHQGEGANPYLAAVIRGVAAYDIAHASQLAQTMPSSHERGDAVDAITRALFMKGVDAAMDFPNSIQDPKLRAGFVEAIANRLAGKDPDQAATWLAASGDAEGQARAARGVAQALAKTDTASAAQWLRKLQPEAQAEAARGIIPIMSSTDIAGTASWASSLAGIPNYDQVVEEFVWSCDYRAPEQSAAWIQGVADPEQRRHLYYSMLGEWAKRDAGAVKTWVSNNAVPPDVLRRFTR